MRALAMVLIALAIAFFGIGMASLGGSGESPEPAAEPATTTSAPPAAAPAPAAPAPPAGATSPADEAPEPSGTTTSAAPADVGPVAIYNNSSVAGLAAETATRVSSAGWTVGTTGNWSAVALAQTTVYYPDEPGQRTTAEQIAAVLGARTAPRIDALPGPADEIVVVAVPG
ncbi:glycoprotein [Rhodococcus rhodnii LMG 5362]|uniref:Glycoprotein n=1 Tax=Rhodococcus rhodnii LMG 5362 TaxID=1273125 RepID=R7WRR4_9NOCA|nr:glycoprotein [Rhodococcus rhodnii LMG 5362]